MARAARWSGLSGRFGDAGRRRSGEADQRIAVTPDLSPAHVRRRCAARPAAGAGADAAQAARRHVLAQGGWPLVYSLLPERWRRRDPAISTVGRLDKDTSGLLLLTDDGALLHRIISPRSQVTKRYDVTLDRPLRGDEARIFASGSLMLDGEDKPLLPVPMEVLSPTQRARDADRGPLSSGAAHVRGRRQSRHGPASRPRWRARVAGRSAGRAIPRSR